MESLDRTTWWCGGRSWANSPRRDVKWQCFPLWLFDQFRSVQWADIKGEWNQLVGTVADLWPWRYEDGCVQCQGEPANPACKLSSEPFFNYDYQTFTQGGHTFFFTFWWEKGKNNREHTITGPVEFKRWHYHTREVRVRSPLQLNLARDSQANWNVRKFYLKIYLVAMCWRCSLRWPKRIIIFQIRQMANMTTIQTGDGHDLLLLSLNVRSMVRMLQQQDNLAHDELSSYSQTSIWLYYFLNNFQVTSVNSLKLSNAPLPVLCICRGVISEDQGIAQSGVFWEETLYVRAK